MCAGAAVLSRIDRVVFGAWDPKTGAAGSVRNITGDGLLHHAVSVTGGVLEEKCGELIRSFLRDPRATRRAARGARRAARGPGGTTSAGGPACPQPRMIPASIARNVSVVPAFRRTFA